MGEVNRQTQEILAKIVYFGAPGAGKTANLQTVHQRLKPEHRGKLQVHPLSESPDASHEHLPVKLGRVRGFNTSLNIHTVPGAPEHKKARGQILENVDGIVFVADLRPERHAATLEALAELQQHLASYGRRLEDVILVIQYNHSDQADANALDALHRRLGLNPAAFFEAVACEGPGVLQTLTTLSKLMLSQIRSKADAAMADSSAPTEPVPSPPPPQPAAPQPAAPQPAAVQAQEKGFRIVSAGPAEGREGEVQLPIRLVDEASGRHLELNLRLSIGES